MNRIQLTIFRRFAIIIFSVITVLGAVFILITYFATNYYHQAGTQLLNKEVAAHIAKFTSPFTNAGIDKQKADSVFENAMVLSPSSEVYFLDPQGKIIDYHSPQSEIRQWQINLVPISRYLDNNGEQFIKGTDPKDPTNDKIFSAAEVRRKNNLLGYIYVILGSKKSENMLDFLLGQHLLGLTLKAFLLVILLSILISFIYIKRMRRNFERMISVLQNFEKGDYSARFPERAHDDFKPVTHAFNKMADLLASAISKVTLSEQERKNFIAIISHDLRTPLSIARGYAETIILKSSQDALPEQDQQHYLKLIHSKILQIEDMVKQLFELSKMDAVQFQPHKEPFVLSEIVEEIFNTSQLIAKQKNILLVSGTTPGHVWINADIKMMERVVQNLLDNAIKSTVEGGKINCELKEENEMLIFQIQNDGAPLPGELLNWINQFKDGDAFSQGRPQQLGLGLLIVQRILFLHHTTLSASSDGGKNTFSFRFPVYSVIPGE